mmetsp:Transcript_18919/g.26886  ORF Transcript_18919/g.26886 Transcript_18919/m.26886 type:complete len:150 (-) Transcript_18919:46-495(-)
MVRVVLLREVFKKSSRSFTPCSAARPQRCCLSSSTTAEDGPTVNSKLDIPSNNLHKTDIAKVFSKEYGITLKLSEEMITSVFDIMSKAIADGQKVSITGFGSFEKVPVAERKGRDFGSGQSMVIPAGMRLKFNAFESLRSKVRSKNDDK